MVQSFKRTLDYILFSICPEAEVQFLKYTWQLLHKFY